MKKWLFALLLLLVPMTALAEGEIVLDVNRVLYGMERSWAQGYEPTITGGAVSICLPLVSDSAAGKLKATLVPDDPAVTPFKNQDMSVRCSRNGDRVYPVRFRLRLLTDYQNGDYPCHIRVEGKDRDGNPLYAEWPLMLHIRGGKDGYAELRAVIEVVDADLRAGETRLLSVRVVNPYPDIEMQDMLLTVTDSKQEVVCENAEEIPVGTLAPGASTEREISMKALPAASVGLHGLKFALTFTALDAKQTWTQTFNLPVSQALRLEQGGAQMADSVIRGDTASLTLPLMNMGRGELRNVCVTLTMPGVADRQSVLVGTIPSGETKQAKLSWSVDKTTETGDHGGTLHISGEDEWGNSTEFDLPVSLTVEERAAEPETDVKSTVLRAAADQRLTFALAGLSGLLLAAFVIQGIILRGKLRRAEEGRL